MDLNLMAYLIASVILIITIPVISLKAYRYGLSDCAKLLNNETIIKDEDIEEEIREPTEAEIIAQNIENYSGDERGQLELEDRSRNISAL